jgi:hypothetical protein
MAHAVTRQTESSFVQGFMGRTGTQEFVGYS